MEARVVEERRKVNTYVEPSLWRKFRELCRKKDTSGSREIREFIRKTLQSEPTLTKTETPPQ